MIDAGREAKFGMQGEEATLEQISIDKSFDVMASHKICARSIFLVERPAFHLMAPRTLCAVFEPIHYLHADDVVLPALHRVDRQHFALHHLVVRIDHVDVFARCLLDGKVACYALPLVLLAEHFHAGMLLGIFAE